MHPFVRLTAVSRMIKTADTAGCDEFQKDFRGGETNPNPAIQRHDASRFRGSARTVPRHLPQVYMVDLLAPAVSQT